MNSQTHKVASVLPTKNQPVIVVGSGPAGIVCALELARHGIACTLMESGVTRFSSPIQDLAELHECDANHAPMSIASRRQFGGASVIWGGRCVPFDPIDFERRDYVPMSGWPIEFPDVAPFYERAAEYFRCGEARFSSYQIKTIKQKTISPLMLDGDLRSSDLERWSLPTNFGKEYRQAVEVNPLIKLLLGHTITRLEFDSNRKCVTSVSGRRIDGKPFQITGSIFVLACGGLDTTRMLLQRGEGYPKGFGNYSDWLGRCYMGHISGQIADVRFNGDPRKIAFGFLRDETGVYLRQRFTISAEAQRKHRINNLSMWLVNPKIGDPRHCNGVLSFAYLALQSPLGSLFAPDAIRQAAINDARGSAMSHVANIVRQSPRTAAFIASFGYKRFLARRRIPGFFQFSKSNQYPLHYHGEQIPNLDSRVALSTECDPTGFPRLNVSLKFSEQDVFSVIRGHEILDASLRRQGAGELIYHSNDRESRVWQQACDGYHQAGTTRMAAKRGDGVVDPNCRVFGTDNLYVASSSTFVTSGQANSTFLIVALVVRLAGHLARLLRNQKVSANG